eukprot:750391-Hanusia_phi.AAC.11
MPSSSRNDTIAGSVAPKDFVIIRSSGELKFGEVVAKTGIVTSTAVFDVKDMYKATDEAVEELMRAKAAPAVGGLFGGLLNNFSPFGGSSDAPKTQKPAASPSPAAPKQAPVKEAPKASAPPSAANAKQVCCLVSAEVVENYVSLPPTQSLVFSEEFSTPSTGSASRALPTQSKKETPAPKQSSSTPQTTPPPPAPKVSPQLCPMSVAHPPAVSSKAQGGGTQISAFGPSDRQGAALNFLNIAEKIIDKVDSEEKPEKEAKVEKKEAPKKSPAPEPVKKVEDIALLHRADTIHGFAGGRAQGCGEGEQSAGEACQQGRAAPSQGEPLIEADRSEDEVPIAKKRALEVNLKRSVALQPAVTRTDRHGRAEREGDLNLGFGAEWENYIPPDV